MDLLMDLSRHPEPNGSATLPHMRPGGCGSVQGVSRSEPSEWRRKLCDSATNDSATALPSSGDLSKRVRISPKDQLLYRRPSNYPGETNRAFIVRKTALRGAVSKRSVMNFAIEWEGFSTRFAKRLKDAWGGIQRFSGVVRGRLPRYGGYKGAMETKPGG